MPNTYPKTALVINCGSTSVKFAIMDPSDGHVFLSGLADALGQPEAELSWKYDGGDKEKAAIANADHAAALEYLVTNVLSANPQLKASIVACGHRIVHGGEYYSHPTLVDDEVVANIEKCIPFAPLHNPAHILGINAARASFPDIPHVTVFDTAFHQTMPPVAYRFAIPTKYYKDLGVRRYGAHGTSHLYLTQRAAALLGREVSEVNLVTCHLGGGASVSAVRNGQCADTSMGLTPLDGLVMATRTGSIDPSVAFFMCLKLGISAQEAAEIFNKKSGLLGVSGVSPDMRVVETEAEKGNADCKLALELFNYRLARFIASYIGILGHVDAIVFSGGIGENSPRTRQETMAILQEAFGIVLDERLNACMAARGDKGGLISAADSKIKVFMIPTNEELMIARSAFEFVK